GAAIRWHSFKKPDFYRGLCCFKGDWSVSTSSSSVPDEGHFSKEGTSVLTTGLRLDRYCKRDFPRCVIRRTNGAECIEGGPYALKTKVSKKWLRYSGNVLKFPSEWFHPELYTASHAPASDWA